MESESGDNWGTATKTMDYFAEVEALAETILADKQQIVDFDQRRNENRLALKYLGTCRRNYFILYLHEKMLKNCI